MLRQMGWVQIYTTEQICMEASPLAPYQHQNSLSDLNSFGSPLYVKVYVCAKEKKSVHLCNTCILPNAFFPLKCYKYRKTPFDMLEMQSSLSWQHRGVFCIAVRLLKLHVTVLYKWSKTERSPATSSANWMFQFRKHHIMATWWCWWA